MSEKITADELKEGKASLGGVSNDEMKKREEEKRKRKEELEKVKNNLEKQTPIFSMFK